LDVVSLASFIAACGGEDKESKMDSAKEHLQDAGQSIKDANKNLKDAGKDTKGAAEDKAKGDSSNNEAQ